MVDTKYKITGGVTGFLVILITTLMLTTSYSICNEGWEETDFTGAYYCVSRDIYRVCDRTTATRCYHVTNSTQYLQTNGIDFSKYTVSWELIEDDSEWNTTIHSIDLDSDGFLNINYSAKYLGKDAETVLIWKKDVLNEKEILLTTESKEVLNQALSFQSFTKEIELHIGELSDVYNITISDITGGGQSYIWNDNMLLNGTLINDSLVAYYKLNENALDQIGNYDGTVTNNVTNTTGHFGDSNHAFRFDGDTGHINAGDITELNSVSAFTISHWIKKDTIDRTDYFWRKFGVSDNIAGYALDSGSGEIYMQINTAGTTPNGKFNIASAGIIAGKWFLLTYVYDGTGSTNADRLKIYVDGVSQTLTFTGTFLNVTPNLSGDDFVFPRDNAFSLDGEIDNFRIYNRSLSVEEINALYQERNDNEANGSVSYAFCIKDCINESKIVGQWNLNGDLNDYYGVYNATNGGGVANYDDCRYDNCTVFTTTGSGMRWSDDPIWDLSYDFTLSYWAKLTNQAATQVTLTTKNATNNYWFGFSSGKMTLSTTQGCSVGSGSPDLRDNQWHQIVYARKGNVLYGYIDGAWVTSGACAGDMTVANIDTFFGTLGGSFDFVGNLDRLILFNGTMNSEDIYRDYLSGYEYFINESVQLNHIDFDGDVSASCSLSNIISDCDTRANIHLKFDGDTSDCINNIADGSLGGGIINTTGFFDNAYYFNGSSYINYASDDDIKISPELTISFWAKSDDGRPSVEEIFGSIYRPTGNQRGWYMSLLTTGALRFVVSPDGGSANYNYATTSVIVPNGQTGWYHVVMQWLPIDDFRIYYNGVKQPVTVQYDRGNTVIYKSIANLSIGAGNEGSSSHFKGSMDDFRIYNYSLSAYEIWELYHARFKNNRTSYTSGEDISSSADFGICTLAGTEYSSWNLSFGEAIDADVTPILNFTNINPANESTLNQLTTITNITGLTTDINASCWYNETTTSVSDVIFDVTGVTDHNITDFNVINGNTYNFIIWCGDTLNSTGEPYTFSVTEAILNVTLNTPSNNSKFNTNEINLTYQVDVPNVISVQNCSLYINDILNSTFTGSILDGVIQNFTQTYPDGSYDWNISCLDNQGNIDSAISRIFSVDSVNPQVNLTVDPISFITDLGSSTNISWSAFDTNLDYTIFNMSFPNGTLLFSDTANSGSVLLNETNLTVVGMYPISFYANDTFGNSATNTSTFNLISGVAPVLTLVSPSAGATVDTDYQLLTYNVTDADNDSVSCVLTGDNITLQTNNSMDTSTGQVITYNWTGNDYITKTWAVNCSDGIFPVQQDSRLLTFRLRITSLTSSLNAIDWVYFTWTNPVNPEWVTNYILIDSILNTTSTDSSFNMTGLSAGASVNISVIPSATFNGTTSSIIGSTFETTLLSCASLNEPFCTQDFLGRCYACDTNRISCTTCANNNWKILIFEDDV